MQLSAEDLTRIREVNPALCDAIVDKLTHRAEQAEIPAYVEALFGAQRRFVEDKSKKKCALCSRRAGKTEGVAVWLLEGARECPGGLSLYIARSRAACRLILWATLMAIESRHNVGLWFREQDSQLVIQTANGHRILLSGCKDSAEVNKFRGLKIKRAAIDEASSFGPFLQELVEDVLEPALLDQDGELVMISTPGIVPTGYFYNISTGGDHPGGSTIKQWSTHSWVTTQNPYIQLEKLSPEERKQELISAESPDYVNPRAENWLREKRSQNGWSEDHPTYQREWLGKWVLDMGALVYPYDSHKNSFFQLPEAHQWTYAIGVDVGYEDDTAFVVGAYRRGHPEVYIVHAESRSHLIPSAVAAQLERLKRKYGAHQIIMDTGGIGRAYAEEIMQKYGVFCEPAQKRDKRAYIEQVRGELLAGTIKIDPYNASPLIQEMASLVWDENHEEQAAHLPDHLCDAFLYLARTLRANYRPVFVADPLTQEDRDKRAMAQHRKETAREVQRRLANQLKQGRPLADIAAGR